MPAMQNPYRLDFTFAVQPVAFDAQPHSDKVRFTGVAYSGGVIPDYGWLGDVAIDLATLKNPDAQNIPVLIDHSAEIENIAGKGNLSRQGNALHITGELTQATEAGKQIAALMAEGYPLQLSVGMQASLRETTEATRQQQVNGQNLSVKAVFEQARIVEVSFVPTGADPHTSAAQFSATPIEPVSQPAKKGVIMTRSPEDQALIDDGAVKQRKAQLNALFGELGRDAPKDTSVYEVMTDHAFSAYCADMLAMKPAPKDRALFQSQATHMAARATVPEAQDKTTALLSAVTQLSSRRHIDRSA